MPIRKIRRKRRSKRRYKGISRQSSHLLWLLLGLSVFMSVLIFVKLLNWSLY